LRQSLVGPMSKFRCLRGVTKISKTSCTLCYDEGQNAFKLDLRDFSHFVLV